VSDGWPVGFCQGAENEAAALALCALRGTTPRRLLEGVVARGLRSAAQTLQHVSRGDLVGPADAEAACSVDLELLRSGIGECGARFVPAGSREYPSALNDLADPPLGLFVRGRPLTEASPMVAIVGARSASTTGREVAHSIGRGLSGSGVFVVSGGARGIDIAGHRGALAEGGRTVTVLGSGIDVPYPRTHADEFDRIAEKGTVVGEYPPGVQALPHHFPARNRIIAALARAVVIVEGAEGSGSMITADHALDLGRPVFAVPGPVTSPLSQVPLALIREGAGLVRGANDLLEDLGLGPLGECGPRGPLEVTARERDVITALAGPTLPEHAALTTGIPLPEVLSLLVHLEMRGIVRSMSGRYELVLAGGGTPSRA
jgi:DNA processing protein